MIEILFKSFSLTMLAKHCRPKLPLTTRMPSELWEGRGRLLLARSVTRKPVFLNHATISMLRRGADKADAAKFAGVSIQSITRLLLTEVGLHGAWTHERQERARKHARRAWSNLCESSGYLGVKWMRSVEPAIFAWLYRNDRAWLDENKPALLEALLVVDPKTQKSPFSNLCATPGRPSRKNRSALQRALG